MILLEKQKQVDKIRDYIMEHRQIYDKLVIFGEATYEDLPKELEEDVFLDVAVRTVREEDATNDDIHFELACEIDDITDGKFNLIIMNDPNVATSVLHEIENGEIIY